MASKLAQFDPKAIIKVKSSDDAVFQVEVGVIQQSTVVRTMLDDLGFDPDNKEEEPITIFNVNSATLRRVLEWCKQHRDEPPVQDENVFDPRERRTDDIDPWDEEFLKVGSGALFDLVLAADYLDIKGLMTVCCKTVANKIKGKYPDEIRAAFSLPSDVTPDEEAQVRQENDWCEDQ